MGWLVGEISPPTHGWIDVGFIDITESKFFCRTSVLAKLGDFEGSLHWAWISERWHIGDAGTGISSRVQKVTDSAFHVADSIKSRRAVKVSRTNCNGRYCNLVRRARSSEIVGQIVHQFFSGILVVTC